MARDVVIKDHGYLKAMKAFTGADGLELRVGISKRFKYPKSRGRTRVDKVAAIHKVHGVNSAFSEAFESAEGYRKAAFERIRRGLVAGRNGPDLILAELGYPLKAMFIDAARTKVDLDSGSGIMKKSIRASVWEGRRKVRGDVM